MVIGYTEGFKANQPRNNDNKPGLTSVDHFDSVTIKLQQTKQYYGHI